jgi:hypothetical protein
MNPCPNRRNFNGGQKSNMSLSDVWSDNLRKKKEIVKSASAGYSGCDLSVEDVFYTKTKFIV